MPVPTNTLPAFVTFNAGVPSVDLDSITIDDAISHAFRLKATDAISGIFGYQDITIVVTMPNYCVYSMTYTDAEVDWTYEVGASVSLTLQEPSVVPLDPDCSYDIDYSIAMEDGSSVPSFISLVEADPSLVLNSVDGNHEGFHRLILTATEPISGVVVTQVQEIEVTLPAICVSSLAFADSAKTY